MKSTRSLGMMGLGLFLILHGLSALFGLTYLVVQVFTALLAVVSGVLILLEK